MKGGSDMSEETVQDSVQEVATESQNESPSSNQDSDLLREVMQKKERLQKAESRVAELEKKMEEDRQSQLAENDEYKMLYEETKAKYDSVTPELQSYKDRDNAEIEKMLADFSEDERDAFKGMNYSQMKVVHSKLINKQTNVPSVDNSTASGYQGYSTLKEAARDVASGKLDKSSYAKIKEAFASKFN